MDNVAVSNHNVHQQKQHLGLQNDFEMPLRDSSGLNIGDMHHSSPTKFTTSNGDVISFRSVALLKKILYHFQYIGLYRVYCFTSTLFFGVLNNYDFPFDFIFRIRTIKGSYKRRFVK